METLDYDHTQHTSDAGDAKLNVIFYSSFIKDEEASSREGRFIAKDVPFTKIFMPGDRTNIIDRPTREQDKQRFPAQWSRYKNAQEQRAEGTPLAEWPILTRGQVEELKYQGFSTVEQLAAASDNVQMMGIQTLKQKAKLFIEVAKGNTAPTEQLIKEHEELKDNYKVMQEALAQLQAESAAAKAAKK
jgi:hypothetical protein